MDAYLDTIPFDKGEEIRELVRERDGFHGEARLPNCPRALTSAISAIGNDVQEFREPPRPEKSLDKYNRERLQRGLRYIERALDQNNTPRLLEFLKLHEDAYQVALDDGPPMEASCAVVQAMDRVYYSAVFQLGPLSTEKYDHLMHYVKLRRLELWDNYSDYIEQELQVIRKNLTTVATGAGAHEATLEVCLPKTWVHAAEKLANSDMGDLGRDVDTPCGILGIDTMHMVWLIEQWADSNRWSRNHTREFISTCNWDGCAVQLSRDLRELLKLHDRDEASRYEKIILGIRDEYFEITVRDEPGSWFPNEKAWKWRKAWCMRENERAKE